MQREIGFRLFVIIQPGLQIKKLDAVLIAQKGVIRALAKSAVCLENLSANGAKVHGKVTAKEF